MGLGSGEVVLATHRCPIHWKVIVFCFFEGLGLKEVLHRFLNFVVVFFLSFVCLLQVLGEEFGCSE